MLKAAKKSKISLAWGECHARENLIMDWYRYFQEQADELYNMAPLTDEMIMREQQRDAFEQGKEREKQRQMIQRGFYEGILGILGQQHFVPRPGATEVSTNPMITPDEIIQESIDRFGDFPIAIVWRNESENKNRTEIMMASKFISKRNAGHFDVEQWTEQQSLMADEWMELMHMNPSEQTLPENKTRLQEIEEKMQEFAWNEKVVKALVAPDWNFPADLEGLSDVREGEYLDNIKKARERGELAW